MRRLIFLAAFAFAAPLFAGVAYRFEVVTTGAQPSTVSGRVEADAKKMRIDVERGDGMLFKDRSVILSLDGGQTMAVLDPAAKSYFVLNLSDFLGATLGSSVKFKNPHVTTRDLGNGGTIEGYPTRHAALDAGYDVEVDVMGATASTHMSIHSEMWRTDRLTALVTPFQMQGLHTGIEALDRLVAAYDEQGKGFPLKEVTTIETKQGRQATRSVSTSTVTHVEQRNIAANDFAIPAGYRQVTSPLRRMTQSIRE